MNLKIITQTTITVDDKYCDERCAYYRASPSISLPAWCVLFGRPCEHCLGGGPLRCNDCLASERGIKLEEKL